jgi:photosystem II stability/assembly factor-like uncharacterized protein
MGLRYITVFLITAIAAITACDLGGPYIGEPPGLPRSPTPENGAKYVSLDIQLSWLCDPNDSGQTLTFDVYLGTENPPPRVATSVGSTTYNPGQLFPGAHYYWKVAAYGENGLIREGPIWHFETVHGVWTQFGSPTAANLNGVAFTDSGTGWAVGDGGTILRYDGVSWIIVPWPGTSRLNGVAVLGNSGWAVGDNGTVLRLSGGTWSDTSIGTDTDLYDVALAGDGSGWLVGGGGTIFQLQTDAWTQIDIGENADLYCTAVYDADDAWLGGGFNTLYEWNGTEWSEIIVELYNPQLLNPAFLAASAYVMNGVPAVWAGGHGVYFSNSIGGEWTLATPPASSAINGIHIKNGTNYGWAVGDNGVIAFYKGGPWSLYGEEGVTGDLNDVFTVEKGEAWAVGNGGVIYRFSPAAP